MRVRAGSDMRHVIVRVQTIGGHAVATGGVRVHVCGGVGYAAASSGCAQHLRRPQFVST